MDLTAIVKILATEQSITSQKAHPLTGREEYEVIDLHKKNFKNMIINSRPTTYSMHEALLHLHNSLLNEQDYYFKNIRLQHPVAPN